jgi:hypothetical protein
MSPGQQWDLYWEVLEAAAEREIPHAIGGGFAVSAYTHRDRDTKDLDIYVLPQHREAMIQLLNDHGLADYYETKPYDRWWIYRGTRDGFIVDVIWAMANHRQQIDDLWMSGPEIELQGRMVKVLPAEALVWDKLYIMQRDRCDWPDILNLLYGVGSQINWEYMLSRLGEDRLLLAGALSVFRWISPGRAAALPSWIWQRLGLPDDSGSNKEIEERNVKLLDTRPWYGPLCQSC